MSLNNWDPLESNLSPEAFSATIKRQIKNILKSYTGWYDPFSELIQNSLDAIENRKKKETNFEPKLWIRIDLQNNSLSVTDNGIGFSEEQFKTFLAPNVSFKKQDSRGNKGVGATYLGYGFNYLQIGTKSPDGYNFIGTLEGGREWVEDESGTVIRPKITQDSQPIHKAFNDIDRGSTFTLKLVGEYIRPKRLNWLGANTAEQWSAVLRIKTPLGGVYFDKESPLIECYLEVLDESGKSTRLVISKPHYLYPHEVISACKELESIREKQRELISRSKDASKLPDSFYKLNGLYNSWDHVSFTSSNGAFAQALDADEKELMNKFKVSCYGFFCYSTEVWDDLNDNVLKLRKNERILRGGIQLATNTMPQGDLLLIPLTRNIGYQNTAHIVIHFENADPDLGRKGFQPELVELAKRVSVLIVNVFLNWRTHLKKDTGAPPDIVGKKKIHEWIREQEDYESSCPLVITRKDVFLPMMEASITSKPLNEQDVIALFNQLLAGGVIRGLKVLATSQHNQYDGVFRIIMKDPAENHLFNAITNPLGIERSRIGTNFVSEPRILEYKYSFDALIEEFEKGEKYERDIELAVAWDMGTKWKTRYEITPLLHHDNVHHRYFHGATHLVKSSMTGEHVFPAVILSELVEYINDPASVQEYQRKTYME